MTIADAFEAVDRLSKLFSAQFWTDAIRDEWADSLADADPAALGDAVTDLAKRTDRVTLAAVHGAVAAQRIGSGDPRRDFSKCPMHCEHGWIEVDLEDGYPPAMKPCPQCRPDTHDKWLRGGYEGDRRPSRTATAGERRVPQAVRDFRRQLQGLGGPKRIGGA